MADVDAIAVGVALECSAVASVIYDASQVAVGGLGTEGPIRTQGLVKAQDVLVLVISLQALGGDSARIRGVHAIGTVEETDAGDRGRADRCTGGRIHTRVGEVLVAEQRSRGTTDRHVGGDRQEIGRASCRERVCQYV